MNIDAKILYKILENQIQQHIRKIIHHKQMKFMHVIQGMVRHMEINVIYTILMKWEKYYTIILKYAEKAFDKILQHFMIKILKLETEENYCNIIKAIYETSTANIILNGENQKLFL